MSEDKLTTAMSNVDQGEKINPIPYEESPLAEKKKGGPTIIPESAFDKQPAGIESILSQELDEEMMETFGPLNLTKADILNEAIGTVGQRNESYDAPEDNFERIAHLWNAWAKSKGWDMTFTPNDVSYMMILMKLGRLAFNPTHHDSIVDICGYGGCAGQIASIERNK